MFETTEHERRHVALVAQFTAVSLNLAIARQRTEALDGAADREHDEARATEYRSLADSSAARAEALQADADKANAAISEHVGG